MALTFSLGSFNFLNLHCVDDPRRPPPWQVTETDITQRPGVNGTGVLLYGLKGRPFEVRTCRDTDTFAAANDLLFEYRSLVADGNQRLVWNSLDYRGRYQTEYVVLDVQPLKCCRITGAVGGLSTSAGGWLEAQWTLIPVLAAGATV